MNLTAIFLSFAVGLCMCAEHLGPKWRTGAKDGSRRRGLAHGSVEDPKLSGGHTYGGNVLPPAIVEPPHPHVLVFPASAEDPNNPNNAGNTNAGNANSVGQGGQQKCTISKYFCNPTGADVIEQVDEKVKTLDECLEMCKKDDKCKFYTFIKFRANPSCFLLRSCDDKKPPCTVPGTCITGKINCQDEVSCPKLKLNTDDEDLAHWRCRGINPYNEDIPSHTTCHTRCPAWTNAAGENMTAVSTCKSDGTWSDPIPQPFGPLFHPPVLNKPDGPDMRCGGCKPLNITYDPNEERGAEFFCDPPVNFANLPAKIDNSVKCNLLCDKMLEAVVECKNTVWTGYPEYGFYCSEKKPPVNYWEP